MSNDPKEGQVPRKEKVAPEGQFVGALLLEAGTEPAIHHHVGNGGQAVLAHGVDTGIPAGGVTDLGRGIAEDQSRQPVARHGPFGESATYHAAE